MSDQNQPSSASSSDLSTTAAAGSPASQISTGSSNRTLVFPPLRESPTSTIYGEQVFYSRNRLSPDRWSLESAEAIRDTATAEVLFDRIMAEVPSSYHQNVVKPPFEPVYYDPEDAPRKYRRMCARAHEIKLKKKLANSGLTAKEIEQYATNATYYPGAVGSKYEPVRAWSFTMTPPRIALTSEEEEDSPRYLFKDLPAELPKKKIPVPSSPATIQPNTAESPASLKRERSSSVLPSKTPDRKPIAEGWKTPTSSFVDAVDHLSPVFDRLKVTRGRRMLEKKSLKSPLASVHETPEHPAKRVPFIKKGPMESAREPDKVIGAFRLKMQSKSNSAPTSSTEPISSSLLSSKGTVATRASSGYQPPYPIVLLVPKPATTEYQTLLDQFSRDFGIEIVEGQFNHEKITHVIFDEDNTDDANLRNIRAIGFQKYLVRVSWIRDCLSNGPMLDPALYEVEAPPSRIARTSNVRLFAGYAFLCAPPFATIERDELWELLVWNGGSIVFNPPDFANHSNQVRVCVVGKLEFYEESKNKQQLRHKLKQWKCVKVHYQWIFEALATYSLPPMIKHLFDSSLEEMRDAGVPEELIN